MTRTLRILSMAAVALALAGCVADHRPRTPGKVIDRALASAPYAAQPSLVVARESAFARAAREDGQWTAFLDFAADDAMLHTANGPVLARDVLTGLKNPAQAVKWSPRTVMMSCDGRMAVSAGRFRDPDGMVGDFVTVWQRDDWDDDYEWIYDVGGNDDPQPVPEARDPDEIVATAYDAVQGLVADCPKDGETVPLPPLISVDGAQSHDGQLSSDRTLEWQWFHFPDGRKRVVARYWKDGEWQLIVDRSLAAASD